MILYATDYDATLNNHGITPELVAAIEIFRKSGNVFCVVSGRPYPSISQQLSHDGIVCDYIIANNGGIITDGAGNTISVMPFSPQLALDLLNDFCVNAREYVRVDMREVYYEFKPVPVCTLTGDGKGVMLADGRVMKDITEITGAYADYEAAGTEADRITEYFGGLVKPLRSGGILLDCVPCRNGKAASICRLSDMLPEKPEVIYTTGDSQNDLDMLVYPGFRGYCVENAHPTVRQAVGRTVSSAMDILTGKV